MSINYIKSLPNEWKIKKFGDVAKITCGIAATPEYVDETIGVPFLSARNVQNGKLNLKKYLYIPIELHKKLTKNTKPEKGDLLLTRVGAGIGESAVVDIDFEFSVYVSLTLIKCGKEINSEFVNHLLGTEHYRNLATRDQFAGGGVQNLNVQMVKEYLLPIPPITEQKKISDILSVWELAISESEKLLANIQKQKNALLQHLLTGKKRLPEFSGEWKHVHLRKLLIEGKERNKSKKIDRVLSITNNRGFILPEDQFSKRVASDDVSNYKVVRNGQFGYNPSRLNIGSFARLDEYDVGLLSPMYVIFSVDKNALDADYFLAWMSSSAARQRFAASTQGSVRDSVGFDALCSLTFLLPPISEQRQLASIFVSADKEIIALQDKIKLLRKEKQALMQQLLTGKRRVNTKTNMEIN